MRPSRPLTLISIGIGLFAVIFFVRDSVRRDTVLAQNVTPASSASNPEMASLNDGSTTKPEKTNLVREGTVMRSQHVIFRNSNNRVMMTMASSSERYICLENLNLQRVTDILRENPTLTDWTVDFTFTEYRGANYALIQKAVLSSAAQRTTSQK